MDVPLSAEARQYVAEHLHDDPATLALQARRYPHLPVPELVRQIQARQKAKAKVPTWADNAELVFPPTLSVEQASSARTAAFKAGLVSGQRLADLTGGFGVDAAHFAASFAEVHYVERNPQLAAVVEHNLAVLGITNVQCHTADAAAWLRAQPDGHFDYIYLDPARRDKADKKIFRLTDCEPDVLRLLPLLLRKARRVLLKTSPMLDIEQAIQELGHVRRLWVVAVDNECKEVLYKLGPEAAVDPERLTVNLLRDGREQSFRLNKTREARAIPRYAEPQQYIYEPNVAVLKAGGFKSIGMSYNLLKLHQHSHLYTSDTLRTDFPGRVFRCLANCRYDKKELLSHLGPEQRAHVTTRNFPDSVADFRYKTGIREGGTLYLLGTTDLRNRLIVLVCERLFFNE
ncbi:class I SAM-dependent methyltransferase [Hymenobacter koreensis]|uniref:SAM-dependent methyltransferase n=1 Tax=Hymenobacter koreensis TaxID=1084523 RepID=A0ABP8IWZ8_9BACT